MMSDVCDKQRCYQPRHALGLCLMHWERAKSEAQNYYGRPVPQPIGVVWYWLCDDCGLRSFATFSSSRDAAFWEASHKREFCRGRRPAPAPVRPVVKQALTAKSFEVAQ